MADKKKKGWLDFVFGKGTLEESAESISKEKVRKRKPTSKKGMDYLKEQIRKTKRKKKGSPPVPDLEKK
jgi:hypothetical protein